MNLLSVFLTVILASFLSKNPVELNQKKNAVTASELKEWISFLSSDAMKGRKNGSPEMKTAADWIGGKFREYGVTPAGPNGDFIQSYTFNSRIGATEERNVIGIIEGSGSELKNQYIVVSAHFDHIGIKRGAAPDSICNGADDNAAGTCAVIGIAKTLSLSKMKPGRSIIFAAFSGEESGMRGSRYFVSASPVPLKNIIADINFEMIGHSEYLGKNNYYMTGCPYSNLDDVIGEYNKKTDIRLIDTIPLASQLFYASDNIAFSRISVANGIAQGIPSGTFATTALSDYLHSVDDEAELFDFENMANLVNYFSDMILWLSNSDSEIKWTDPKFTRPQ
jgi:Zn-dependent M28 family amino/carboxypeptidase